MTTVAAALLLCVYWAWTLTISSLPKYNSPPSPASVLSLAPCCSHRFRRAALVCRSRWWLKHMDVAFIPKAIVTTRCKAVEKRAGGPVGSMWKNLTWRGYRVGVGVGVEKQSPERDPAIGLGGEREGTHLESAVCIESHRHNTGAHGPSLPGEEDAHVSRRRRQVLPEPLGVGGRDLGM